MLRQLNVKKSPVLAGLIAFFMVIVLSSPTVAIPGEVQTFIRNLTPEMESLLQQKLERRQVFFDLTPKAERNATRLDPYSRIHRDTVFDLRVNYGENLPTLTGKVFDWQERDVIERVANQSFANGVRSQVAIFPYNDVDLDYGITIKPYSNLYTKPSTDIADLATQVRLGTPVKLLQYSGDRRFVRVRIEDDGYLAWIKREDLKECDRDTFKQWVTAPKLQIARTLNRPQTLYFGTRLPYRQLSPAANFIGPIMPNTALKQAGAESEAITVILPDNREVQLNRRDVILPESSPREKARLLEIAKQFLPQGAQGGGRYLWGGTVGTRLDCSGFVQTVFRTGNIYLPRDAYQQKLYTQPVAGSLRNIDELKPGDLVFFSENRRLATHVGIYLGNYRFIHSTRRGGYSGVKINRLRNGTRYDRYFQRTYFGGGRVPMQLIGDRAA